MNRRLKTVLIAIAVVFVLCASGYCGLKKLLQNALTSPMCPENYAETVKTGGELEAKYLAMGASSVGYFETDYPDDKDVGKIEIWYPKELETTDAKFPVVLFVNGTGVFASRYKPVFEQLASWGFIAVGNEDPSTWEGKKAAATLDWLLKASEDETSVFYGKVDVDRIGTTGHSQGGVGAFNLINETGRKELFKCAVSLSPTAEKLAAVLRIPYYPGKTTIPILLICAANGDVLSPEDQANSYEKINAPKAKAVRKNAGHGETLYFADGYATAWFAWFLKDDQEARKAFVGEDAEFLTNPLYRNQKVDVPETP